MKIIVLFLVIIGTVAVFSADNEDDWVAFKIKFGKLFLSKNKEAKRKAAFFKNKARFDELQAKYKAGHISYKPGMYEFHDLEPEEMNIYMNGNTKLVFEEEEHGEEIFNERPSTRQSLPTNYSSAPLLNDVKYQGACGACYAFSAISAVEGSVKFKTGVSVNLSEQFLVDCVYANTSLNGCGGGAPVTAINFMVKNGGAVEQSEYPWNRVMGTCNMTKPRRVLVLNKTRIANETDIMKNAVMKFGSLMISVAAFEWAQYRSGIFQASAISDQNHMANLVGWGYDPTLQRPYWLVRNSWGKRWGEDGYIRLAADVEPLVNSWATIWTYAVYVPDKPLL